MGILSLRGVILGAVTFLVASTSYGYTLISNAGKPAYWKNGQVGFYFHSSVDAPTQNQFRLSFATWQNVPGLSLIIQELGSVTSAPSSDDGKNTINWITSNWRNLSFRPPSNALAVTLLSFDANDGSITDADIYFNSESFQWGEVGGAGTSSLIDVQNIATHEIGHLLGLDHSSEKFFEEDEALADATMYYASGAGETSRRSLKADDLAAISALYSSTTPATPAITSVVELSRDKDEVVEYQVIGSNFSEQTSFVLTRGSTIDSDRVGRYRTIVSSNEARVHIDLAGFSSGGAELVAFNHPSALSTYAMTVDTASISATSSGGGGCALSATGDPEFSWVTFYFVSLSMLSLLLARRRFRQRAEGQPEESL